MPPRINLPPLTRALLLALITLSSLNAVLRFRGWQASTSLAEQSATSPTIYLTGPRWAIPYLVLIPTKSIRYPWTFLTSSLIENNVVSLTISSAVVWFGGKYLERAWGSQEFAKFVLFVTMIPNVLTFFLYALWHGVVGQTAEHPTPLNGLLALSASFLVALRQLVPEHTVSLLNSIVRIRIKHLPVVFVAANMLSGPLLGTDTALWLSLFGFLTGWIYLRFYRISDIGASALEAGESVAMGARMRGDPSETFAFVEFFPVFLQPFVAPFIDTIYDTLVQLRVCVPFTDSAVEAATMDATGRSENGASLESAGQQGGAMSARRAEAERRRALALKALDERLSVAATNKAASVGTSTSSGGATESESTTGNTATAAIEGNRNNN